MTSGKTIELTIRVAMMIKAASELIGARGNVPLCHMQLRAVKQQLKEIEEFLNTAEVEK